MSAAPHTSPYDPFAAIYDRWMAEEFCRRVFPAVATLLLARLPAGAHLLDLCCGSGQMARALLARGFRVTGVDASEMMLQCARQNAPGADFVLADARRLQLPRVFEGALSTFNSLAHLETAADLELVFRNVRAALATGAAFLFDLSMEAAYTSKWRGALATLGDDHVCILRPSYDRALRVGRNDVTLFRRVEPRAPATRAGNSRPHALGMASAAPTDWIRMDFCIEQKCHSEDELRQALRAAGFREVDSYDSQRDLGIAGEWGRTFFLCR
jgi:SAM-dependent methyltransferase